MDRTSRYLIISKENKSKKNIHSDIHKLLQSINDTTGLSCDKNLVSVQGRSFRYELKMMNTDSQEDNKKFFVLIFYLEKESDIEQFEFMDSELNNFIESYNNLEMFILEDALSQYYSKEAYELIHVIENKTRALISEVMFLKSNTQNWETRLTNSLSIRDNRKSKEKKYKPLDGKYFSDLSKILFTIYEEKNDENHGQENFIEALGNLDSVISNISKNLEVGDLNNWQDIEKKLRMANSQILKTSPRSIWDRYISDSIKESDKLSNSLSTVLSQSIAKRNAIAHNTFFRKDDYETLKKDVEKVVSQISKALNSFEDNLISKYTYVEENEMLDTLDALVGVDSDKENNPDDIEDDLTIIVPAQEEGFQQVFLEDHEWYDIRIGKTKKNKIRYIAGYEVAPRSGIQYVAKVKDIVESDNFLGYWKLIFDGKPEKYANLIPLGDTYPPQNIRYTTKHALDEVAKNGETLEKIFNNPY